MGLERLDVQELLLVAELGGEGEFELFAVDFLSEVEEVDFALQARRGAGKRGSEAEVQRAAMLASAQAGVDAASC